MHEGIASVESVRFIDTAHRALAADNGSSFCIVQFGHAAAFPFGMHLADHFHITDDGAAWCTEPSPAIDQPFVN